jgi:propanediol utilization protein
MTEIEKIPPEEISGPQPGFVQFTFSKSDTEQINVRIPIRDYMDKAGGKSGTELFKLFYTPPFNPT